MTRQEICNVAEFAAILAREHPLASPGFLAERIASLCLAARKHHRAMERACNVGIDDSEDDACENRVLRVVTSLDLDGKGFGVVFSGDPRGATVKLTVPSGLTNDWGQTGVVVPIGAA